MVTLVCDNLNTHTIGAFYQVFPPEHARKYVEKIYFAHTPKNGSWLNLAECECPDAGVGRFMLHASLKGSLNDNDKPQRRCVEFVALVLYPRWLLARSRANFSYTDCVTFDQSTKPR